MQTPTKSPAGTRRGLGDGTATGVDQSPDGGAEHPADAGEGGQGPRLAAAAADELV